MCLAVPMRLVALESKESGTAEMDGVRCTVNLSLINDPQIGDYLIIHTGFAIEKLDAEEASKRLQLFEELASGNKE